jgi:ParB family chromosome partitioning protein
VPVVVKRATDREKMIMSIIENVQRSDLNCVEEALAYYQLMNEYKLTQEDVAKKLGKERSTVANFLRSSKSSKAYY